MIIAIHLPPIMTGDLSETAPGETAGMAGKAPAENLEQPVFNVDGVAYAIADLPESVTILINDLLRFNQEQSELQFRLRTLQAAQQTYVSAIKQELEVLGVRPLSSSGDQGLVVE